MKYSERLEHWEQEAYNGGWGADWLETIGENVKFYALKCETSDEQPTFAGLMNHLESVYC